MRIDKHVGFRRNIFLPWLDAAATFCLATTALAELRARLDGIVGAQIASKENRRMAVDILVNIWFKSGDDYPGLRAVALELYGASTLATDRLWLHYGMTLLTYGFFRSSCAAIGLLSRNQDAITPAEVKRLLIAERGALGGLDKAVERVIFSLRNWDLLAETDVRSSYAPRRRYLSATSRTFDTWMLAVGLEGHRGNELAFADLLRRPEFFPLRFSISVDELRRHAAFSVYRQGGSLDMVGLTRPP